MGKWMVDSGATSHMTREKQILSDYREFETPEKVGLGDGRTVDAIGVGNVYVSMLFKVSKPKRSYTESAVCAKACLQPVFCESKATRQC